MEPSASNGNPEAPAQPELSDDFQTSFVSAADAQALKSALDLALEDYASETGLISPDLTCTCVNCCAWIPVPKRD